MSSYCHRAAEPHAHVRLRILHTHLRLRCVASKNPGYKLNTGMWPVVTTSLKKPECSAEPTAAPAPEDAGWLVDIVCEPSARAALENCHAPDVFAGTLRSCSSRISAYGTRRGCTSARCPSLASPSPTGCRSACTRISSALRSWSCSGERFRMTCARHRRQAVQRSTETANNDLYFYLLRKIVFFKIAENCKL